MAKSVFEILHDKVDADAKAIAGALAAGHAEPDADKLEAQLPKPTGYRILIALPEIEETFKNSSLIKTEAQKHKDYIMSIMGVVVDLGPDAYSDKERFPGGSWCKPGDYVMFRMNTGTRFKVSGKEFRLMNDDSVEAIIPDPSGVMAI